MTTTMGTSLAWIGVALFAAVALFSVVTLPVEFDASRRAKQQLVAGGIVIGNEIQVNAVLSAAAMTYVAGRGAGDLDAALLRLSADGAAG